METGQLDNNTRKATNEKENLRMTHSKVSELKNETLKFSRDKTIWRTYIIH